MGLFQEIKREAEKRGLDFLVIGGLAVNFHGYSRDTVDLDLLVQRDLRRSWLELFSTLGYVVERDAETFIQFEPPKAGAWPVDLMLVGGPTFKAIRASGIEVEMYGVQLPVPSLDHLLALKLHALKHSHAGRYLKDLLDVENLVRANGVDLALEKTRQLFLKYGTLELYERLCRLSAGERF